MTVDERYVKEANLEFFESNFLNAQVPWQFGVPILHSIGVIEATLWLRLGIDLDFFDEESVVQKLFSIEDALSKAWAILQGTPHIFIDKWCDFITPEAGGKPRFMRERYLQAFENEVLPRNLELSKQTFLSHLLLTSEVIFEPSTMFFLESIGWSSDVAWQSRLEGLERPEYPEHLYTGFANHVRYLVQFWEFLYEPSSYPGRPLSESLYPALPARLQHIIGPRIIINRQSAKQRCFEFGGDLVATLRQSGPEWLQMRGATYNALNLATKSTDFLEDMRERDRFWPVFVAHSNRERLMVPVERSEEVQQVELAEPTIYEAEVGRPGQESAEPASHEEGESSKNKTP